MNSKGIDHSISLVQMGDSMVQKDDLSALQQRVVDRQQLEAECNVNDSQLTGNFEKEADCPINQSGAHYMNELSHSQQDDKNHFLDKPGAINRNSI